LGTSSSPFVKTVIRLFICASEPGNLFIGCVIKYLNREGCLPLQIQPNSLRGGLITLSAETSSQFVSSVLLSAPCAREPVSLKLTGTITSEPFIDMTVRMMAAFGVNVKYVNNDHYEIPRGVYKNPAVKNKLV